MLVRIYRVFLVVAVAIGVVWGKPAVVEKTVSAGASLGTSGQPLFTFDNGNVGVNFLGYHASAGLGGLLSGNTAQGGLHASAGTPFGQRAGAGLGGTVEGGKTAGGLYAGATDGFNSAGVAKYGAKVAVAPSAEYHKEVEVVEHEAKPQTTLVERTVIPNYVEKTIQVPSYVEKTVRVPTYVEKTIRVPAEPTIVEKEVNHGESVDLGAGASGGTVVQKTKFKYHARPYVYKNFGYYGGGYGGGSYGTSSAHVNKNVNAQFFNDIFNIPLATLGAVNKFLGGVAGGTSGSVSVSKSYGTFP